ALSDVDRDLVVDELLEELLQRRDADALDSLGRPARDELRRVAREHDRALLPCLDRAVGRDVERERRPGRVGRAGDGEVEDLHEITAYGERGASGASVPRVAPRTDSSSARS